MTTSQRIQCQNGSQLLLHESCQAMQAFHALHVGELAPRTIVGVLGGLHGQLDIFGVADGNVRDDGAAVLGVLERKALVRLGGDEGAVDVCFLGEVGWVEGLCC